MSYETITNSRPERKLHLGARPEKPEKRRGEGEELLYRCGFAELQEVEFMRQVLRAGKPGASEEILDRCGCSGPQEIGYMRQVLKANRP